MSYCTPREPNFGFLNHGCNAYGGLLLNEKLFFQSPRTCESVFIPQHNLGNYWKRPYLDPHALGFSKFLTHLFDKDESADILTENTILHGRSLCRRNRNLLTGCALDESTVQFWTCNERSARRRILEFSLSQECFDNGEETWNILPKNGDTSPVKVAEMQSPLVQLRHLSKINEQNFLFGQCIDGLFVINTTSKAISAVFSGAIENFSLVPYLQNEVIILDSGHLLWHGDLNATTTLSRVKTSSFIQHISSSDHPRKLYTAGYDKVYVTDLRESSSPGKELFSIPDYGSTDNCAPKIRYGECFTKPVIKHLQSPNNVYRNLLVATSKKFYLLDERMPFKPCLETAHSIFGGGDYICCAPPFSDNENTAGSVYGFYILQHSLPSDVQYFSLYDHGNALQWSMISPIKRFMEPSGAVDFYNQQPKYGIFINSRHKAALFGFEKTKAIHVQDGLAKNKHGYERHLLLRQTGNGSIWLDSLTIVNDDCLEDEALQNNAREIRQRVYSLIQCEEPYTVGGGFKKDFCKIYPDEMTYCKRIKKTGAEKGIESHFSPLDVSCCTDYPIPEVAITTDNSENRLASNCYYFVLTGCENFAYGFRGSLGSSAPTDEKAVDEKGDGVSWCIYDTGNLSQTYVALCLLIILGDDLSKVDKEAILIGVGCCQLSDGSFCSHRGSENDMRFVFTGVAICFILNDFSTVNVPKILEYIKRSINYDGGIGEGPGTESHAGSTYCAIASLHMLGSLWDNSVLSHKQIERLKKWCLMKQSEGFHGRTNKPDDSCYAYWVGATLQMLDAHSFFDHNAVRRFLMSVQDRFNGFSRETDTNPDILHTYFSIAGLSLIHEPFLCPLYSPLNVTYRTYERLLKLQAKSK